MITQIFSKDILKILTIFSLSPGSKFQRKELKEKTKLNNVNLDNGLNILLNSHLIKKERNFLSLNFRNENAKNIMNLISEEYRILKELPLEVYFSIIDIIYLLSKLKKLDIYLFGSYAKLIFRENSDIDIAIVSNKINLKEKKEFNKLIKKLESRYKKTIEVHYFKKNFYKNKKDLFVKDILKNGVKLI